MTTTPKVRPTVAIVNWLTWLDESTAPHPKKTSAKVPSTSAASFCWIPGAALVGASAAGTAALSAMLWLPS